MVSRRLGKHVESNAARLAREARERREERRGRTRSQSTLGGDEFQPTEENANQEDLNQEGLNQENLNQENVNQENREGSSEHSEHSEGNGGNQPTYEELLTRLQQTEEENREFRARQVETDKLMAEIIAEREKQKVKRKVPVSSRLRTL